MDFYDDPADLVAFLTRKGVIDEMYNALHQNDTGNIVLTALDILKKTNSMPDISESLKREEFSELLLCLAKNKDHSQALRAINQAIAFAPKKSNAMANAYLSRCRILFDMHAISACLEDIEMCLAICPASEHTALNAMRKACLGLRWYEDIAKTIYENDFFEFDVERHPLVPCLSKAVDFNTEGEIPKVVAAKDISVGTLVALEPAHVAQLSEDNVYVACHYCHKLTPNLIPCDTCVRCLFCSKSCKDRCWKEFHSVECHLFNVYNKICPTINRYNLMTRAAIKLKCSCSWKEFISMSSTMGLEKMKTSPMNEIYDVNNKASLLNFNDDKYFVSGLIFNGSFTVATIIHYLEKVPSFFPRDPNEKKEAMRALGRVILNLYVTFPNILDITNSAYNMCLKQVTTEPEENCGLFSFTSKLRHSCEPNVLLVGLNHKMALIAWKPIKAGEELQISYIGHWYENIYEDRRHFRLFQASEIMCRCRVCMGQWDPRHHLRAAALTSQQRKIFNRWNKKCGTFQPQQAAEIFKESCHCLNNISEFPQTKEHRQVFKIFRNTLNFFQYSATGNATVP